MKRLMRIAVATAATSCVVFFAASLLTPGQTVSQAVKPLKHRPETKSEPTTLRNTAPQGSLGKEVAKRQHESSRLEDMGENALSESRFATAEDYFHQALKLDENNFSAWASLAEVLERQGKPNEALSAYRSLTKSSPNHSSSLQQEPRILMPYALLCVQAGQWAEAVQAYETGREQHNKQRDSAQPPVDVAFDPQTPQPKQLQAMAHLLLGAAYDKHYEERNKALVHYEAAAKAEPHSAIVQFYYGYGLRNANRREEANAAFEKAASLGQGEVRAAAQKMRR